MKSRTDWVLVAMWLNLLGCAAIVSYFYPLLYCWIAGIIACAIIFGVMGVVLSQMSLIGYLIYGQYFIEAMLQLIGYILLALLKASAGGGSSSSD